MTNKLDDMIRDALGDQDAALLRESGEIGFLPESLGLFKGRDAWVYWVVTIAQTAMFLAGAWCAWHFYLTEDLLMAVRWGFTASVLLLAATVLKLSLMPVIQANRIIREIRRLELLVAVQRG